jgi:hypothetical protein
VVVAEQKQDATSTHTSTANRRAGVAAQGCHRLLQHHHHAASKHLLTAAIVHRCAIGRRRPAGNHHIIIAHLLFMIKPPIYLSMHVHLLDESKQSNNPASGRALDR